MKRIVLTSLFVASCLLGMAAGYFGGGMAAFRKAWNGEMNAAMQVYRGNLLSRNQEPQLREFLKERLYCLTAQVDRGAIQYNDIDFGPVDYAILGTSFACADGSWKGRTHQMAVQKHSPTKPEPWSYKKQ